MPNKANSEAVSRNKVADISWIDDDLLDALAWTESTHQNKTNTTSGAAGYYQWMPAFYRDGKEIGFGVDSGAFDPYDIEESRKRAKQYLIGLQKHYPDWDPTEVLMAYNWGHSNVRKFKDGTLNVEQYMAKSPWHEKKVSEAMNYPKKTIKFLMDMPWAENILKNELK